MLVPDFNTQGKKFPSKLGLTEGSQTDVTNSNSIQFHPKSHSIISFGNHESSVLETTNKLLLTGDLFFNKELIIDHLGLKDSLRKKKDSKIFFGISNSKDYTGTFYNDFIINCNVKPTHQELPNYTGRIFEISYSKKTNDYQIYMIHNSMCLYYQIEQIFYFESDREYLILIGKFFLTVIQREAQNKKFVNIKLELIEDENDNGEEFEFSEDDSPITIGRINSKITINNSSISKSHAVIEFSESEKKFLYKDVKSTNGSVLIMKEDDSLKIKGNMKFKLNDIIFHILELP